MIRKDDVVKIGYFAKPHGIKGEVALNFTNDIFDRTDCSYLIAELEGILVPFFVEEYRFKSDTTALIRFENVTTEEGAREFTGLQVYFPKALLQDEDLEEDYTWNYYVGFKLVDDVHGEIGVIENVDESTINILFQLTANGKELLIPAAEELITEINHDQKLLYMQIPEGLLNLEDVTEVC